MSEVLAHWTSKTEVTVGLTAGSVVSSIAGDLEFEFSACQAGNTSRTCDKFDSAIIGTAPLAKTAGGTSFQITGWVHKGSEPDQFVGFYYTVTGGTTEIDVKAGQNHDRATLDAGSGYWLDPACTGDPGPGGSVTCNPMNTRAISNISFCLVSSTPPCTPITRTITASNVGSIPQILNVSLMGTAPIDGAYCEGFHLTIDRHPRGSPALFDGPLCDLTISGAQLAEQIDPGASLDYDLTLALSEPTSDFNGTTGTFNAIFSALQWNEPGVWTDLVDRPMTIVVGSAPSTSVRSKSILTSTSKTINSPTVAVDDLASLPAVIDVFDESTVTITSWIRDSSDPSTTVGFEFAVTGDPVYVEVIRGTASWVDERWASEGPHTWRTPFRSGAVPVSITSIEFGLVPGAAGPPTTQPSQDLPPADLAPDDELPVVDSPPPEPPRDEDTAPIEQPVEEPPEIVPPPPELVSLSGSVWLDEDSDGIRGDTEKGVAGVTVRIVNGDTEVATTTTAPDGAYAFTALEKGDYTVLIEAPEGHEFTTLDQGEDDGRDSDVTVVDPAGNPVLGRVAIALGSSDGTSADAGLIETMQGAGGG